MSERPSSSASRLNETLMTSPSSSHLSFALKRLRSLSCDKLLIILILASTVFDHGSFGQSTVLPVRGVEEVGRSYIGEPLSAYIGHMAMLFVTGKHPTVGNGTM